MDDKFINEIKKIVLKEINSKEWYDLTFDEINLIEDLKKRQNYIEEYYSCFKDIINPLFSSINTKEYNFTDDMTCKQIVITLKELYLKNNKTTEDIYNIVLERNKKK